MRILSLIFLALATTATVLIIGSLKRNSYHQKETDEFPLIVGDMPYAQPMEEMISSRS